MLETVCRHLNNYFDKERIFDTFTVVTDSISAASSDLSKRIAKKQFYRIVGSSFNDGIYIYPTKGTLIPETFEGAVWLLAFPEEFLRLVEEIAQWQEKYGKAAASPFTTEAVTGVYSYTKSGSSEGSSWQSAFRERLDVWRKIV